jgi:HTH-type transcriptional regulator/antitoxin HigA
MSIRTRTGKLRDVYFDLIRQLPLRPIRSEEALEEAIHMIDSLVDREKLLQEEKDYLEVLSDLVERYEAEVHVIDPVSDDVLLRHLLEAKQVTQSEVARRTGIAVSTISEVLAGKRALNRKQIGKLVDYFRIGPEAFAFSAAGVPQRKAATPSN